MNRPSNCRAGTRTPSSPRPPEPQPADLPEPLPVGSISRWAEGVIRNWECSSRTGACAFRRLRAGLLTLLGSGRTVTTACFLALSPGFLPAAEPAPSDPSWVLRVTDRPMIQRGFLPDSSPRSLAVGLPDGVSLCFDADQCRVRYAWRGGFLDMQPTWHERGAAPPRLLGGRFFAAPDGSPLRLGRSDRDPTVKFLGYSVTRDAPEIRYTADGHPVRLRVLPADQGRVHLEFVLEQPPAGVWFRMTEGMTLPAAASPAPAWAQIPVPAGANPLRFDVFLGAPPVPGEAPPSPPPPPR